MWGSLQLRLDLTKAGLDTHNSARHAFHHYSIEITVYECINAISSLVRFCGLLDIHECLSGSEGPGQPINQLKVTTGLASHLDLHFYSIFGPLFVLFKSKCFVCTCGFHQPI